MVRKVYISEEICAAALEKMVKLMESKATGANPASTQLNAAKGIVSACQTQERYNLRPMTEGDYDHHVTYPNSKAKALDDMTTEELLALRSDLDSTKFP